MKFKLVRDIKLTMSVRKKHYYLKKETLAKSLLRSCRQDLQDIAYFDKLIAETYDMNKKQFEKYKDRVKKLTELYNEFNINPRQFVEKYATIDNNKNILRILKQNPKLFRNE